MDNSRKSPPQRHLGVGLEDIANTNIARNGIKFPSKIIRVLSALISGRMLNRYEAAEDPTIFDTCLNTTISEIQHRLGIPVARKYRTVVGYAGYPVTFCQYWLEPNARLMAWLILDNHNSEISA